MHRFFVAEIAGETAFITDAEQIHHLRDVLRLKVGDTVAVSDNTGKEFTGRIAAITKKQAEIKVTAQKEARESSVKLTVACALPKGARFDDVVDFLTELGVERIIPLLTERVVVKLDDARAAEKHRRWLKIAQSAARQSQRARVPAIDPVTAFEAVVANSADYGLKLIPHLSGDRKMIKDVLASSRARGIIALIGPEGDFTPAEVKLALANNFVAVSLGDTVLRVAAAAVAVASFIKLSADS